MRNAIKQSIIITIIIYAIIAFCKIEINPFLWGEGLRASFCFISLVSSGIWLLILNDLN